METKLLGFSIGRGSGALNKGVKTQELILSKLKKLNAVRRTNPWPGLYKKKTRHFCESRTNGLPTTLGKLLSLQLGNPLFSTNLLEVSRGRDFGALKGLRSLSVSGKKWQKKMLPRDLGLSTRRGKKHLHFSNIDLGDTHFSVEAL